MGIKFTSEIGNNIFWFAYYNNQGTVLYCMYTIANDFKTQSLFYNCDRKQSINVVQTSTTSLLVIHAYDRLYTTTFNLCI